MVVFLKLGGSLITDKARHQTARLDVLKQIAAEIVQAKVANPELQLLIGHGSGSFGHMEAKKYNTRIGVISSDDWLGYAKVANIADRLNRHVMDTLLNAEVPAMRFQPSASTVCRAGEVQYMAVDPILTVLKHGVVPVLYGVVALDREKGGTIASTEQIFSYLAKSIQPTRILLAGIENGVLTRFPDGEVIPHISPSNIGQIRQVLQGSAAVDVTGGMETKVMEMVGLVTEVPKLEIVIYNGLQRGATYNLLSQKSQIGTLISI